MTYADELRNGKGLEKKTFSGDRKEVESVLDVLKKCALDNNRAGNHFVDTGITYYGYDWDEWRALDIHHKVILDDLGAGGLGVKKSDAQFEFLQAEVKKAWKT